ncbi:hypothetical protein LXL04_029240 [Taraxacum kok-saghyz]
MVTIGENTVIISVLTVDRSRELGTTIGNREMSSKRTSDDRKQRRSDSSPQASIGNREMSIGAASGCKLNGIGAA